MVDVPPTAAVGSSAEKADLSQDDWRKTNKHDAAKAERDKPGAPYAALGRVLAITLVMAVAAATLILGNFTSLTFWIRIGLGTNSSVDERVHRILSDTPLIDGHSDFAIELRFSYSNHIYQQNFTHDFNKGDIGHVDLAKLKQGRVGGTFWVAFAFCPNNDTDFSTENYAPVVANTLTQIDLLRRLQAAYPSEFSAPGNSSTALSAFRSGQIISPLAIEGLHQIGNSLSTLRLYHSLGVRYATLTHNCHNIYADAAITESLSGELVPATPYWGGLSPAGREAIHEMARLGMIVDLSHVSHDTMRDVLGDSMGTRVPVIFSHSNAYAVCPHPRNVPDDVLHLVKKRHSLVMVTFPPPFVSCRSTSDESGDTKKLPEFYPENSTLAHVVRHIKYIGELIGYDHVGLGSDYDGMPDTPRGLENVSKFLDLVAEILRQGITDEDAAKVVGGNILRVWNDVDAVAEKLQANGEKPAEDNLPWLKRHYS